MYFQVLFALLIALCSPGLGANPEVGGAPLYKVTLEPQSVVDADGKPLRTTIELTAGRAENAEQAQALQAAFSNELAEERADNPEIEPTAILAVDTTQAQPGEIGTDLATLATVSKTTPHLLKLPLGWFQKLSARLGNWFFQPRVYRFTFAGMRLLVNGQVAMRTVMLTRDLPIEGVWPVWLVAGGLSAGFMYFNEEWQRLLLKPSRLRVALGVSADSLTGKALDGAGAFGLWLGVELVMTSLSKAMVWYLGATPETDFASVAENAALTAAITTVGEFPFGYSIAKVTQNAKIKTESSSAHLRSQVFSDLTVLGCSMLGTLGSFAQLMKVRYSHVVMAVVGLSGWISYGVVFFKKWKADRSDAKTGVAAETVLGASCASAVVREGEEGPPS